MFIEEKKFVHCARPFSMLVTIKFLSYQIVGERARAKKNKNFEPIEFYIIVNIHHIKSRQNGMSTITFELELSSNERSGAYIEVR